MEKTKALTFGVFDFFHIGHLCFFERCKEYADYLIVAVQDGEFIQRFKPNAKILYTTEERVKILKALRIVDEVIVYENIAEAITQIEYFDILILTEDQIGERFDIAERWCVDHGKKVLKLERTPGISSSSIKQTLSLL